MLLNVGADVHAQREYYGNALQAVSYHGHEKVVQMLVNAGADAGESDLVSATGQMVIILLSLFKSWSLGDHSTAEKVHGLGSRQ
jgi:hypothetical protein